MRSLKLLLFLLLLSLALPVCSQIQLGIKAGYFIYTGTGTGRDGGENTAINPTPDSYVVSLSASQRSTKTFNVGIDLEYLTRSLDASDVESSAGSTQHGSFHFKLDELCLYIKPQFVLGHKVRFIIFPALFFGYFVNTKVDGTETSWTMGIQHVKQVNGSAKSYITPLDFGLAAGLEVDFPVGKGFFLTAENSYSIHIASGFTSSRFVNMKLEAGLAYRFSTGIKPK